MVCSALSVGLNNLSVHGAKGTFGASYYLSDEIKYSILHAVILYFTAIFYTFIENLRKTI